MSADEVLMYMRKAKQCASQDNQIDALIRAIQKAGEAIRELEAKVKRLENKW
jgi:hypothetical protein